MKITICSLLISLGLQAQVTLRVTSVPSNTPAGASVYLAGNVNGWNPGDAASVLQPDGLGQLTITIPESSGTVEYKFTRGSWTSVEGNATGGYLPNRSFSFTGSPQTIDLTIQSWEDLGGTGNPSTAAANVQVLTDNFFMPQLNSNRRIWLYLPPDYESTSKEYPVLYMQIGQILFITATSFAGEWQVDETLNNLFSAGDYGAIVVGIDNGGAARLDEYSPWLNAEYNQGGDGQAYMQFVAETLKPYIDANFRTLPQATYTALIGSSMGALISAYGLCAYPGQFEKAGLFSPAFWFALDDLQDYIDNQASGFGNMRTYFVCGQNESPSMVSDMVAVENNLLANGVPTDEIASVVDPLGTHSESFWRAKFGAAYQWLFGTTPLSVQQTVATAAGIRQLIDGTLYAVGIDKADAKLYSVSGAQVASFVLSDGRNSLPQLPTGLYLLRAPGVQPIKIFIR